MTLLTRSWHRAWAALQATPPPSLFDRLVACYDEPHRRYHTLQHLSECIERLEPALGLAEHPGEVEIALWFHDAVYQLQSQNNELESALWARRELDAARLSTDSADRVYALVMVTQHSALPQTPDARLLVDVDLSILGAGPARFAEYEAQIRAEYGWVPDEVFRAKRQDVLRGFLARRYIYNTDDFRARYEAQARLNLEGACP